jgi:UDP-N-acetylglucosamine 2-epimerase (non-hydrolysing)
MASIHLCPTESNELNIKLGDNKNSKTFVVGNTVLDNLKDINPSINNQVLITMHRRENLVIIDEWFRAINRLAINNPHLEFIFPMHLNPEIQKHKHTLTNVKVTNPLSHDQFVELLSRCGLVITDSGGIQEETAFLKKKSIVCRKNTERNEGEGVFSYICWSPDNLEEVFDKTKIELVNDPCPYGNGDSSGVILQILERLYYGK